MFERLILCEYAVADLTTANANVFYELGVRHAVAAVAPCCVFADGRALPFDSRLTACLPYKLDARGCPADVERRPCTRSSTALRSRPRRRTDHRQPGLPAGRRLADAGRSTA